MDEIKGIAKSADIYSSLIFKIGLVLVVLSTLFLFSNLTSEFFETPKFLVLLAFSSLLLVLIALRFTITGKVVFVRTPLDIPLLLILAVAGVSTFLSSSPFVALLGNQLKVHSSLVSIVTYIIFYFVLINSLKNAREVKWILVLAVIASQVLALISLLSFAGIKILPPPWNVATNFTPTGSAFSTTAILALLLPFIILQILGSSKATLKLLYSLSFIISGVTIVLTGTWATWIGALLGIFLVFIVSNLSDLKNLTKLNPVTIISLTIPLVIIALVAVFSFIPPIGGAKNPIYTQVQSFPREIQLPFVTSWKIAVSSFRDSPFWGTGPSTYTFNFTNYKPIEFNSEKTWNLRFDSSFNEYLQVLATLGGIGLLALVSLTTLFASSAFSTILKAAKNPFHLQESNNKVALAISGIVFFALLLLHPSTLPLWVMGLLILASFMVVSLSDSMHSNWGSTSDIKGMFLKVAANVTSSNPSKETVRVDALPGVLLVIFLALTLTAFFFAGKYALADYHHRLALNAVAQNQGIVAYNELIAAEKLNPQSDLYRTDLAQVNFALANAIAAAKGPTEASPTGSLTDQDKQNIQVLLSQSINEARTAVTLSPKSAINWEILAVLYRQISGVAQNALVFSLDSYGRAIFQDPLNPQLRVNVGGVYYAIKNYDLAIRFFTDAINLKPDFANGYYNLSVALKDKGDLAGAQATAEKLLTLIEDKNSQDYKTAEAYLNDLKAKIAEGTKEQTPAVPPAAEDNTALQQEKLPKVIDLPKPEKIATPTAVKKPNSTPEPTAQPTPEATANP